MIFRVYFNSHADYPNVWSVDDGDQRHERTCEAVVLCKCFWRTEVMDPEQRKIVAAQAVPTAWIAVEASRAELVGNKIVFVP